VDDYGISVIGLDLFFPFFIVKTIFAPTGRRGRSFSLCSLDQRGRECQTG
jgi:hypothetical protein